MTGRRCLMSFLKLLTGDRQAFVQSVTFHILEGRQLQTLEQDLRESQVTGFR